MLSFSITVVHAQCDDYKPYTLRVKDSAGKYTNSLTYLYADANIAEGINVAKKELPPINSPDYCNYEWYFIPVGDNEPGKYYIRNGNGLYLFYKKDMAVLKDKTDEDGFKWFISGIQIQSAYRERHNSVRLYVMYDNKSYVTEVNTYRKINIKSAPTINMNTLHIEYSRPEDFNYNGDMELITAYPLITSGVKSEIPPLTSEPDFSPDYFPLDYNKNIDSQARLIHSRASSGGHDNGHYFLRLKSGDVLTKTIDNPALTEDTFLKLSLRARATVASDQAALLSFRDASGNVLPHVPMEITRAASPYLNDFEPDAWQAIEFYFDADALLQCAELIIECTTDEGDRLDIDDIKVEITDKKPDGYPDTLYWHPVDGNGSDWNCAENWQDGKGTRGYIADKKTNVVLPSGENTYPILKEQDISRCKNIRFEDGAQLGNSFYLDYDHAEISFNLNTMQWYGLTAPLHGAYSGDYLFDYANPITEMRLFKTENPQTGAYYADWTTSFATTTHPLGAAMPFSVRVGRVFYTQVDENNGADMSSREFIDEIELHFPKTTTTFRFFDEISKIPTGKEEHLPDDARRWSHRFIYETEEDGEMLVPTSDILFNILTDAEGEEVVMLGNPFMAGLDFEVFYRHNHRSIYPEYKLLVGGNEYVTWSGIDGNNNGSIDSFAAAEESLTGTIPPMTSFAVRTRNDYKGDYLQITKSMNRLDLSLLDAKTDLPSEGLRVELEQDGQTALALLLFGNDYNDAYLLSEDARKMQIRENGRKPSVYTVVDDQYLEINRMRELRQSLPVGISLVSESPCMFEKTTCATFKNEMSKNVRIFRFFSNFLQKGTKYL